ncbi:MAG: DNA ligase D [Chitinophagaceae bacterium]|nr:DNA ligase D [Chitinophagaceae bacterium]
MSLSLYKKKRHFTDTPEPEGEEKSSKGKLRFVIQKHDASHLHYDFRLEMKGVLKSWAIPKGPSLNPDDKRLAMMVEDHPYDYKDFEGIIPEGNYGAGTVIIWDEGTYQSMGNEHLSKDEQEKVLLKQLHAGDLKLNLHGKKIKGTFALFQLKKDPDQKSWLLVKKRDEFATDEDVTKKDKSVKSGKTIAQIARENGTVPKHPEQSQEDEIKRQAKTSTKSTDKSSRKKKAVDIDELLGDFSHLAKKRSMPQNIKPMLATLVEEPFDNTDWLFEIKWDGYRSLAYLTGNSVELVSRNNLSFTEKYQPVTDALRQLNLNAVIDGEIVAVNEKGIPEFQLMQNWQSMNEGILQFYAFDVLWIEGYDVTALPLIERKKILQSIVPESDIIKYSGHVSEAGKDFFNAALKLGLEGIMAKKINSTYEINARSKDWLKIKVNKRQEVVIAGFTLPRNSREYFGALLLGVYEGDKFIYVGHTGGGFNQKSLKEVWSKLQPLITDKCPFEKIPKTNMPATWVKPKLVCEIKFSEWTKEMIARHPIFMGLREDKDPKDVTIERTSAVQSDSPENSKIKSQKATAKAKTTIKSETKSSQKRTSSKEKTSGLQIDWKNDPEQLIALNGHELKLTNLDKFYWKKEKRTKGDMINYYLKVAPYMLPYMVDRPQSLNRHPNGIDGENFYQKDMAGKVPEWIQLHDYYSESTEETIRFLVCRDEATLIYMANLGCIEMHPWHSRVQSPVNPDWSLIDLDPDDISFNKVIECAQVVKKMLDSLKIPCYCKTSGSTGLHIYIPLGAKYTYEQSRQLAELVVTLVHHEIPTYTSIERNPSKRRGKIYLDYLQNREIQTAAAPYSLRPKPGMPVSTPLHWDEVKKGITPTTFNMTNIFDRLKAEGDLFKPVLSKGIDLGQVLKNVQALSV